MVKCFQILEPPGNKHVFKIYYCIGNLFVSGVLFLLFVYNLSDRWNFPFTWGH